MSGYKHIEEAIGTFIGMRYRRCVEVGYGGNTIAASIIQRMGGSVLCLDLKAFPAAKGVRAAVDDITQPDLRLYIGSDCIYSIRPGIEMMPDLIALARRVGSDLLIYHLGCELYQKGGEKIDCGVILHRYRPTRRPYLEREEC